MTTFTFPAPAQLLTLNQRMHFHKRNDITQAWRTAAAVHALQAKTPATDRAHITIAFAFPTRAHRDVHNWTPTAKAIVDGITDAGILPDDCDCHLTLDIRRAPKTDQKTTQVTITIDQSPTSTKGAAA